MAKTQEQTNDWPSREVNAIIPASQTPSENESDFSDETECFDVDDHSRPLVDPASSSKPAAAMGYYDDRESNRESPSTDRGKAPRQRGQYQDRSNNVRPAERAYKIHQQAEDPDKAEEAVNIKGPGHRFTYEAWTEILGLPPLAAREPFPSTNPIQSIRASPSEHGAEYCPATIQVPQKSASHTGHFRPHFTMEGRPRKVDASLQGHQRRPRNRNHSHSSRNPGDDTGYYHTNPGIGSREGSNYNIPEGYQNEVGEQKRRHPHEPQGY